MKYAIVDMGSNSMRLSVYQIFPDKKFELLFSEKEMAGLNSYIHDGLMTYAGIQKACTVLKQFQDLLSHLKIQEMHVFATAPLRNIENTEEALQEIKRQTGLDVDVISGVEESKLGYYGAIHGIQIENGAIFDIGGGSTEIAEICGNTICHAQSIPLGSLQLYNQNVEKFWPKKKECKAIRDKITETFSEITLPERKKRMVCGVGGTARAVLKIANVLLERPDDTRTLTAKELSYVCQTLLKRDETASSLVLRVCPDRIHTILPGLLLMSMVCRSLCANVLYVSPYGVREGYVYWHQQRDEGLAETGKEE